MKNLINFMRDEDGQGMVEYGLIIGLIAIVVVGALVLLGPKIKDLFTGVGDALESTAEASA